MLDYMLDDFSVCGKDLPSYIQAAEEMDNHTELVPLDFSDATLFHVYRDDGIHYLMKRIVPGNPFKVSNTGIYALTDDVRLAKANIAAAGEGFLKEFWKKNKTIWYFDKKGKYFVGETFYKTFGAKITSIGGKFLRTSSIERDIALSRLIFEECIPKGYALIRTFENIPKIFGFYTSRYKRVPFETLADAVDLFPLKKRLIFWKITQKKAEIYIELGDPSFFGENIVPGLLLTTSDTAYSQTSVKMCWRNKEAIDDESYFVQDELTAKHSTEVTRDDIIKMMIDATEQIKNFLSRYNQYRMELSNIKIMSPKTYHSVVKKLAVEADLKKLLGVTGWKLAIEWLGTQYNESADSAVYILDKMISLTGVIGSLSNNQKEEFRNTLRNLVA